jgi:hypothetical protein
MEIPGLLHVRRTITARSKATYTDGLAYAWDRDVGRTIDAAGYIDDTGMTVESCISFCSSRGLQYAGVEYSHECYCGSLLAPAAAKVAESDCSTACAGNTTEACGGGSRLSLFYSSVPVGPQPNPGVNGWAYIGCYR